MSIVMILLGGVLVVCGVIACVVPVLPGPILSFCGLLCLIPTAHGPSVTALVVMGVVTAIATMLDYIVPAWGAQKFKCSRWGVAGCVVGTIVGMFFFPYGLLLGPFCGAFLVELIAKRKPLQAAKGGLGAFLGFLSGVFIKLVACMAMLAYFIHCL